MDVYGRYNELVNGDKNSWFYKPTFTSLKIPAPSCNEKHGGFSNGVTRLAIGIPGYPMEITFRIIKPFGGNP